MTQGEFLSLIERYGKALYWLGYYTHDGDIAEAKRRADELYEEITTALRGMKMIREAVVTIKATIEITLTEEALAAAEGDPVQAVQDEIGHTGAIVTAAEVI